MADIDLEELKRLLDAATPGPWKAYHAKLRPQLSDTTVDEVQDAEGDAVVFWSGFDSARGQSETKKRRRTNARLIALTPTLARRVLELAAEVERLRGSAVEANIDRHYSRQEQVERAEAAEAKLREIAIHSEAAIADDSCTGLSYRTLLRILKLARFS